MTTSSSAAQQTKDKWSSFKGSAKEEVLLTVHDRSGPMSELERQVYRQHPYIQAESQSLKDATFTKRILQGLAAAGLTVLVSMSFTQALHAKKEHQLVDETMAKGPAASIYISQNKFKPTSEPGMKTIANGIENAQLLSHAIFAIGGNECVVFYGGDVKCKVDAQSGQSESKAAIGATTSDLGRVIEMGSITGTSGKIFLTERGGYDITTGNTTKDKAGNDKSIFIENSLISSIRQQYKKPGESDAILQFLLVKKISEALSVTHSNRSINDADVATSANREAFKYLLDRGMSEDDAQAVAGKALAEITYNKKPAGLFDRAFYAALQTESSFNNSDNHSYEKQK